MNAQAPEFPLNLLFSRADIPRIKENTQRPLFQGFWQELLEEDINEDKNFLRDAFIYVVTGDIARGQQSRLEMLKFLEEEHWDAFVEDGVHRLGFLKTGRYTAWMALGYDWLYDLLMPKERREVLRQITEKGCVPIARGLKGMLEPEKHQGWGDAPETETLYDVPDRSRWPHILGHNNFRAVMSGGLALGIFAVQDLEPRAAEWKELLIGSFYRFTERYETDGSYDEGVGYSNYATSNLIYLMQSVQRKTGRNLFGAANFTGLLEFNMKMYLPQHTLPGGSVNFGDALNSLNSDIGFWIARQSRDGLAQYIAENMNSGHTFYSLIWYDPTVIPEPPTGTRALHRLDLDWIISRTGYEMDDLVVAMRSGGPMNHEHADRNSVILKYAGEVLLADARKPTYDRHKPDWFLRTSPTHNTILIDGQGHQYHDGSEGTNESKASAKIKRFGKRKNHMFWASDATPAYSLVMPDVKKVTRTVIILDQIPALVVVDKLQKNKQPSLFTARWHVENQDRNGKMQVAENTFSSIRPHGQFYAVCGGRPVISVQTGRHRLPEKIGVFPYTDLTTTVPATDALLITAGCPLTTGEEKPEIQVKPDGQNWIIKITKNGKTTRVHILDNGELPEFFIN